MGRITVIEAVNSYIRFIKRKGINSVEDLILPERKNSTVKPHSRIRASKLGDCPIDVRLYMKGKSPQFPDVVLKKMAEGTAVHELFQSVTGRFWKGMELSFQNQNLTGHVDALTEDSIIEIKSASTMPETPDDIYRKYWYQLGAYFHLTGLRKGYFIFINKKDLSDIRVFEINKPQIVSKIENIALQKVREILTVDVNDTSYVEKTKCSGCPMKNHCPALSIQMKENLREIDSWIQSDLNLHYSK